MEAPAFPVHGPELRSYGMTLRDYFAAQVATGLMTESDCVTAKDWKTFAEAAYGFADAMLEARDPRLAARRAEGPSERSERGGQG